MLAQGCSRKQRSAGNYLGESRNNYFQTPQGFWQNLRMSQSLSAVFVHIVFSTKDRRPFFRDLELRARTHQYVAGISKRVDCDPVLVGGVEDHVHMLCRLGRTISQSEWIKEVK